MRRVAVLWAALILTLSAAETRANGLRSSRLGYVPAIPTKKGIRGKIEAFRVKRSQKLLRKLEASTQAKLGLIKHGHYHNMVLRGAAADGTPVSIVAGKHWGFPFVSSEGSWDNVQVKVGSRCFAVNRSQGNLAGLKIAFAGEGPSRKILVTYEGAARELRGTQHEAKDYHRARLPQPVQLGNTTLRLRLELDARSLGMLPMGVPKLFGMEYFPRKVAPTSKGELTIGNGRAVSLQRVSGEMETGRMNNLTAWRGLSAVYDYRGVAAKDGTGHVQFTGRGAGSGKQGKLARIYDRAFDGAARLLGTRQFGFGPSGIKHDQALPLAEARIVAHDVIQYPNGVTLERRMVEGKDARGKSRVGLQERFFR